MNALVQNYFQTFKITTFNRQFLLSNCSKVHRRLRAAKKKRKKKRDLKFYLVLSRKRTLHDCDVGACGRCQSGHHPPRVDDLFEGLCEWGDRRAHVRRSVKNVNRIMPFAVVHIGSVFPSFTFCKENEQNQRLKVVYYITTRHCPRHHGGAGSRRRSFPDSYQSL